MTDRGSSHGRQSRAARSRKIPERGTAIPAMFMHALVSRGPESSLVGEPSACLGIDVQLSRPTPRCELLRIDGHADDARTSGLDLLLSGLGALLPCVIGEGQVVSVRHDRARRCIIVAPIPGDADRADLHEREISI